MPLCLSSAPAAGNSSNLARVSQSPPRDARSIGLSTDLASELGRTGTEPSDFRFTGVTSGGSECRSVVGRASPKVSVAADRDDLSVLAVRSGSVRAASGGAGRTVSGSRSSDVGVVRWPGCGWSPTSMKDSTGGVDSGCPGFSTSGPRLGRRGCGVGACCAKGDSRSSEMASPGVAGCWTSE